ASQIGQETKEDLRQAKVSHLGAEGERVAEESSPDSETVADPVVGERVRVKGFNQTGIVRRRDGDSVKVEIGLMRTTVPIVGLITATGASSAPSFSLTRGATFASPGVRRDASSERSVSEINVIGESAEDALSRVDKFLDDAFLAQRPRVRVV